jgi:hypothetical protein
MGPYERIGFLLFLSGGLVYFLLIWPTLTNNDRKSYYVGGHKLWFVYYWGIYYFFDLAAYRRKRLREGKPLFVWWVSITIVILFVFVAYRRIRVSLLSHSVWTTWPMDRETRSELGICTVLCRLVRQDRENFGKSS